MYSRIVAIRTAVWIIDDRSQKLILPIRLTDNLIYFQAYVIPKMAPILHSYKGQLSNSSNSIYLTFYSFRSLPDRFWVVPVQGQSAVHLSRLAM